MKSTIPYAILHGVVEINEMHYNLYLRSVVDG